MQQEVPLPIPVYNMLTQATRTCMVGLTDIRTEEQDQTHDQQHGGVHLLVLIIRPTLDLSHDLLVSKLHVLCHVSHVVPGSPAWRKQVMVAIFDC